MTYKGRNYENAWKSIEPLIFIVGIVTLVYFGTRSTIPNPPNNHTFGCYVTEAAAPIRLDGAGMHILQTGFATIPFHLERNKTGIVLTAERPIDVAVNGNRYVYFIEPQGVGRFLNFYAVINGKRYGVFDANELKQFSMLARDGKELFYHKAQSTKC